MAHSITDVEPRWRDFVRFYDCDFCKAPAGELCRKANGSTRVRPHGPRRARPDRDAPGVPGPDKSAINTIGCPRCGVGPGVKCLGVGSFHRARWVEAARYNIIQRPANWGKSKKPKKQQGPKTLPGSFEQGKRR